MCRRQGLDAGQTDAVCWRVCSCSTTTATCDKDSTHCCGRTCGAKNENLCFVAPFQPIANDAVTCGHFGGGGGAASISAMDARRTFTFFPFFFRPPDPAPADGGAPVDDTLDTPLDRLTPLFTLPLLPLRGRWNTRAPAALAAAVVTLPGEPGPTPPAAAATLPGRGGVPGSEAGRGGGGGVAYPDLRGGGGTRLTERNSPYAVLRGPHPVPTP